MRQLTRANANPRNDLQAYYTTQKIKSQVKNITAKKIQADRLQSHIAAAYATTGKTATAENIQTCGAFLMFKQYADEEKTNKITSLNLCHNKYCLFCQSVKAARNLRKLSCICNDTDKLRYKFLTLTIPSVKVEQLHETIKKMSIAFNIFNGRLKRNHACTGFYKSLELTYNNIANTYHPHLHLLLEMPYTKQKELAKSWTACCESAGIIQDKNQKEAGKTFSVFIQAAYKPHELCKYVIKPDTLTEKSVWELIKNNALYGVRNSAAGGSIKQAITKYEKELKHEQHEIKSKLDKMAYEEIRLMWFGNGYKQLTGGLI